MRMPQEMLPLLLRHSRFYFAAPGHRLFPRCGKNCSAVYGFHTFFRLSDRRAVAGTALVMADTTEKLPQTHLIDPWIRRQPKI